MFYIIVFAFGAFWGFSMKMVSLWVGFVDWVWNLLTNHGPTPDILPWKWWISGLGLWIGYGTSWQIMAHPYIHWGLLQLQNGNGELVGWVCELGLELAEKEWPTPDTQETYGGHCVEGEGPNQMVQPIMKYHLLPWIGAAVCKEPDDSLFNICLVWLAWKNWVSIPSFLVWLLSSHFIETTLVRFIWQDIKQAFSSIHQHLSCVVVKPRTRSHAPSFLIWFFSCHFHHTTIVLFSGQPNEACFSKHFQTFSFIKCLATRPFWWCTHPSSKPTFHQVVHL